MSEAFKTDEGKLRMDLVPVTAIKAIARGLGHGLNKYPARNWEAGLAYGRVYGALLRHLTAWWDGEEIDPESGLSHLDHVLCCAAMLEGTVTGGLGEDDRPKRPKKKIDYENLQAVTQAWLNLQHWNCKEENCWQCLSNER